jgi:hypothetical protein
MDENNIFDKLDIENETSFKTDISNTFEEYEVNCRLVKFTEEPLMVFCELDESIPPGNYSIKFSNIGVIYKNNSIIIDSYSSFDFQKFDLDIPNLYADFQNITVEEHKDSIEIIFNIISYNKEQLFIGNPENMHFEILDDCKEYNKHLF